MGDNLAYIVTQTHENIQFLVSHDQISYSDGQEILSKLPAAKLRVENDPYRGPSPAVPSRLFQARAIWGYNEQSQDPNDLTFHPGDIIDIVAETNADWWTGRLNGHQGVFPSNYVEKIGPPLPSPSLRSEKPMTPMYNPPQQYPPGPPSYQPSYNGPPRPPVNQYLGPPMQSSGPVIYGRPPSAVQAPPVPPPKKHKFGNLGNTLAQAAVGGVGFGAGSAIGGDIVNSIF